MPILLTLLSSIVFIRGIARVNGSPVFGFHFSICAPFSFKCTFAEIPLINNSLDMYYRKHTSIDILERISITKLKPIYLW